MSERDERPVSVRRHTCPVCHGYEKGCRDCNWTGTYEGWSRERQLEDEGPGNRTLTGDR